MQLVQMRDFVKLCLLFSLLTPPAFAGTTGKITGQVIDENGYPLPGAAVYIEDTTHGAFTDEEGVYFLLSVEPGFHALVAQMIGYESLRKTEVRVTSDFTTNVSFALEEDPMLLEEIVVEAQQGESGWGMLNAKSNAPPVAPDKTMSQYIVRAEDIEALPIIRDMTQFIELQAGVVVDETGEEITLRAGDEADVGYYLDGVPLPSTDHAQTRVYRNFNRLSVQEMTVLTGGMNAEYGNAQGGIVSVITREGKGGYHGLADYLFIPPGKKHWGENVYDSPIHQDRVKWDDPAWVAETVTLPDGREVPAHRRRDYMGVSGHFLEGMLSGPLTENLSFLVSSRWQRQPAVFPGPYSATPFNLNTLAKVTARTENGIKINVGGLYDRRKGAFDPIGLQSIAGESFRSALGPSLGVPSEGQDLFLVNPRPSGEFYDTDHLVYLGISHMLSDKTFYEVRLSRSVSSRDTSGVHLPQGITHISEAVSADPVWDQARAFVVYRDMVAWERFDRQRWALKADLSSQINRRHFLKAGFEAIRYNNWYQAYSSANPQDRRVAWYGKTYEDTDFFPGHQNKGVTPIQVGVYAQDKIEFDGMIVNAGLRAEAFFQNDDVTDVDGFYGGGSPMWHNMARNRNAPTIRGAPIKALSPRLGISHPMSERSILRFFYGRLVQFPSFQHLYYNSWQSNRSGIDTPHDIDLNENGVIDPAERWNGFGNGQNRPGGISGGWQHNPHLPPEETISLEVGADWNFVTDYVLGLTLYYKSGNNQIRSASQQWVNPETPAYVFAIQAFAPGIFRDTRGIELSIKKRFSQLFAFNFALNLQWADESIRSAHRRDTWPDSLFVANGHYWVDWDIDPATGAEIPVSLTEKARRDYLNVQQTRDALRQELGREPKTSEIADESELTAGAVNAFLQGEDPDLYIRTFGHAANEQIQKKHVNVEIASRSWSWVPWYGHYAADGVELKPGQKDRSFYSDKDADFWERLNSTPGYPGTGEGNLMVGHNQESGGRGSAIRDRRSFGSMAFLFATPPGWGPLNGKALGQMRANLIYRFYTGTPIDYAPVVFDPKAPGGRRGLRPIQKNGPMHTRVDLSVEKALGDPSKVNLALAGEVINLFNQKDPRSTAPGNNTAIDFDSDRWQQWGIDGLGPVSSASVQTEEFFDINNAWDQPREIRFGARLKW